MQHELIMNCSFSYQRKWFILFFTESDKTFCVPIVRNVFLLTLTVIITERFNIHSSRVTWLVATWFFLLCCEPNTINVPLLCCWHWVKSFWTATILHNCQNIFQNIFQYFFGFNTFQFGKHSSLALETETVNNNLIMNSTSLHPLLLDVLKILRHVTRYETLARERILFAYFTNPYQCSKRLEIDNFIPAFFNGIKNCSHVAKIKLFCIQCFFLFVCKWWRKNERLRVIFL